MAGSDRVIDRCPQGRPDLLGRPLAVDPHECARLVVVLDDGSGVRREDDEETVEERLDVFAANTRPVVEYYDEAGQLVRIDGEGSPEEVWAGLRAAIDDAI